MRLSFSPITAPGLNEKTKTIFAFGATRAER